MPKIIVTSRFIKPGEASHLAYYVNYIATREGTVYNRSDNSALTELNGESANDDNNRPPTKKQEELIKQLLKDFKTSEELFEYEDYITFPTRKTASDFITAAIDRNADIVFGKNAYVHYLGERPGVVEAGDGHGLFSFSSVKNIDLKAVADEVSHHDGNVWTHVVSLRREDAQKVGYAYDNNPQASADAWRSLVRKHILTMAEATKIKPENLKWYAAYHDKENNPHVHIMIYSKDAKEGFLTNNGIEKIRSAFANDIYSVELSALNDRQTRFRNTLKSEAEEAFRMIKSEWLNGKYEDGDELVKSINKLRLQLADYKGKKVYKYMKPEVKETINDISRILYRNKDIQKLYNLWCECQSQRISIYTSAKTEFPKLEDNPEFKSVKNMILREVFSSLDSDRTVSNTQASHAETAEVNEALPSTVQLAVDNTALLKAAEERGNEFAKQVIESYGQQHRSYAVSTGISFFAGIIRMFDNNSIGDNKKFIKRIAAVDKLDMLKELEKKQAHGQKI